MVLSSLNEASMDQLEKYGGGEGARLRPPPPFTVGF
jgi:hypothetical protein